MTQGKSTPVGILVLGQADLRQQRVEPRQARLEEAIMVTITGIAAGMRNTG